MGDGTKQKKIVLTVEQLIVTGHRVNQNPVVIPLRIHLEILKSLMNS
jgi:hypothetical protein